MNTHNICFCRGDSNEYPQHIFMRKYGKLFLNYHQIPILSVSLNIIQFSQLQSSPHFEFKENFSYPENMDGWMS